MDYLCWTVCFNYGFLITFFSECYCSCMFVKVYSQLCCSLVECKILFVCISLNLLFNMHFSGLFGLASRYSLTNYQRF